MRKKREKWFFIGVLAVVALVILYAFSSHQSQEDYWQQLKEYREKKDKMFRTSDESPLDKKDKKQFTQLSYFEPDLSYRVEASVERFAIKETIKINTSTNVPRTYVKYAKLKFVLQGVPCELLVLKPTRGLDNITTSSSLLFLPFTDETSGIETYGAGRYLDFEEPKGDKLILDFNYAYNPYCAYNTMFDCPIPPAENHLPVKVLAGEKAYATHQH